MPLSFISSLIGGGGGLGFTDSSTNSNTNTSQNSNFNTNTSGSTQRTLLPSQASLLSPYASEITNLMSPSGAEAYVAPFTQASMDSTNSAYSGLAQTLAQQFMSTGNGQSGKFGTALVQGNLQRLGALQGVQTTGQEEAAALPLQAAGLAQQFLGTNFGQTTTGTTSGTSATTGTSSTKSSSSGFSL